MMQTIDRRFKGLMENIGENGADKMVKAAYRFLELAEQKALTAYRKEDGTYTLTDPQEKQKEQTSAFLDRFSTDGTNTRRATA